MKKQLITATVVAIGLSLGTVAFAAASTPAEKYAELKGITVEEAYAQRQVGEKFGELAEEAGEGDAFRAWMLETKVEAIEARVEEGTLTREEADEIIAELKENIENCDGTGECSLSGKDLGLRFGGGAGKGSRFGAGSGNADGTCGFTNEDGTTGMGRGGAAKGRGMNGTGEGMGRGRR